jgi:hypothetical protein
MASVGPIDGMVPTQRTTNPLEEWPNTEPESVVTGTSDYLDLEDEAIIALGLKKSAISAESKPKIDVLLAEGTGLSRSNRLSMVGTRTCLTTMKAGKTLSAMRI